MRTVKMSKVMHNSLVFIVCCPRESHPPVSTAGNESLKSLLGTQLVTLLVLTAACVFHFINLPNAAFEYETDFHLRIPVKKSDNGCGCAPFERDLRYGDTL